MPGVADPLYVRARAALLVAAEALEAHRDALVLVGAQAIYLQTGDADLAVAEYTTDADFTVAPADLADAPLLADLLGARGFAPREHPGGWLSPDGIYLDIMAPEDLADPGTRGARLGPHGKRAARRAKGLRARSSTARASRSVPSIPPIAEPSRCGLPGLEHSSSPRSTRSPSVSATRTGYATRTLSTCFAFSAPSRPSS
jgi:hypothetical protein